MESAAVTEACEQHGYKHILWSISIDDWADQSPDSIASRAIARAHPGGVVSMHDRESTNDGTLRGDTERPPKLIVSELKERGNEFMTIPELLQQ